ncbi:MAG: BrnT family toxin [Methylococcales bacterium]
MRYVWDSAKAEANLTEHDVSFAGAVTVLGDEFALTREDPHSERELFCLRWNLTFPCLF